MVTDPACWLGHAILASPSLQVNSLVSSINAGSEISHASSISLHSTALKAQGLPRICLACRELESDLFYNIILAILPCTRNLLSTLHGGRVWSQLSQGLMIACSETAFNKSAHLLRT